MQYAVVELPTIRYDESESIYAVPACTAWLDDITVTMRTKDNKQVIFAAVCKWLPDESKLSDYLEKKKKPTNTWIKYENIKILKFCSKY